MKNPIHHLIVPEVERKEVNHNWIEVNDFVNGISKSNFNMNLLYRNLKSLDIKFIPIYMMSDPHNAAEYNTEFNAIRLNKKNYRECIMHELFHMSSTYVAESRIYSGFLQTSLIDYSCLGVGLTEGYTQVLTNRYFKNYANKKSLIEESYEVITNLVEILESLLTPEAMEKMYSEANLLGLFYEMASISSKKEAFKFIRDLDLLYYYFDTREIPNLPVSFKAYHDCMAYLTKLTMHLLTEAYSNKNMTKKEYIHCLKELKVLSQRQIKVGYLKLIRSKKYSDKEFERDLNTIKKRLKV